MSDTELTPAQVAGGFDAWVKEDRIPPIQRKHHLKTWNRALAVAKQLAAAPVVDQHVAVFDGYLDGGAAVIQWRGKALPAGTPLYAAPVSK